MVSFRKAVTVAIAAIAATLMMADSAVAKEGAPAEAKATVRHAYLGGYGYGFPGYHTSSHKKFRRRLRRRFGHHGGHGYYGHGGHGYYGGHGYHGGRRGYGGYGRGYYY